jgi:hypothetical protein
MKINTLIGVICFVGAGFLMGELPLLKIVSIAVLVTVGEVIWKLQ